MDGLNGDAPVRALWHQVGHEPEMLLVSVFLATEKDRPRWGRIWNARKRKEGTVGFARDASSSSCVSILRVSVDRLHG